MDRKPKRQVFKTHQEPKDEAPLAKAAPKPGKNLIAVHCHQTGGGQYVDIGFVKIEPAGKN
jgi:hypothetical protein